MIACLVMGLAAASPALADFQRWSVVVEDDPFDGKGRLSINYMDSLKSGVIILCEQGSNKITVRRASMFPFDQSSPPASSVTMALIVDRGESHLGFASTGLLGTGNVGFDLVREGDSARRLLQEMKDGKSKLYIKLGEADPEQFSLRGSTKAAEKALGYCFPA